MAGYATALTAFVRSELPAREASNVWFLKTYLFRFHRIYLLFDSSKPLFLDVLL